MTSFLVRLFIKNHEDTANPAVREKHGFLAAIAGILCNLILFGTKLLVGVITRSIAIMADAFNNLSDAGSSIITLIGFKMSGKPADKEHPYGHARIEYITGFIISIVIFLLGLELIRSSVEKIINPVPILYDPLPAAALAAAIGVKLWMGMFYRNIARRINSGALKAASADSLNDAIATASVLAATIFAWITGLQIDGFMGVGVALFILYSGIKLIRETLNPLLGEAPDASLVERIECKIRSYDGVIGLHDLVLHNYGPERCFATVHVEVPASRDIMESHEIIDRIEKDFSTELGINLVIHMDPTVTDDERLNGIRDAVGDIIREIDPVLTMHDFRAVFGKRQTNLIFDVVVPPGYPVSNEKLTSRISEKVREYNPDYYSVITVDKNYISSTHK